MRNKTQCGTNLPDNDRYQLDGWGIDIDDFGNCANLLKILQKKITLPILRRDEQIKHHILNRVQKCSFLQETTRKTCELPTNTTKKPQLRVVRQNHNQDNIVVSSDIIDSRQKKMSLCSNHLKKNSQFHPTLTQKFPSNLLPLKQKSKSSKNFVKTYIQFFELNKSHDKEKKNEINPKLGALKRIKNSNIQPLQVALQKYEIDFNNNVAKEELHNRIKTQKFIKLKEFCINQKRATEIIGNLGKLDPKERRLKVVKSGKRLNTIPSINVEAERKSKRKSNKRTRILKTQEAEMFVDAHLQDRDKELLRQNISKIHTHIQFE